MEEKLRQFLNSKFKDSIIREDDFRREQSFYIKPESLFPICEALLENNELDVKFLKDITAVDWYKHSQAQNGRFEIIYNLYSFSHKYRFFLKVNLPEENPTILSLTGLWSGANWLEREVFDLFGVIFEGHPDLTKILTPDELEGHPLRKDFPLTYEKPQFSWNKDKPPEVIK